MAYQLLDDTVKWMMFDRLYGFITIKHGVRVVDSTSVYVRFNINSSCNVHIGYIAIQKQLF